MHVGVHTIAFAYADEHRVAFASVEKALHMLVPVVVCADTVAFAYAEEHRVAVASSVDEAFHMVVWGDRVAFASSAVMHMVSSHLENWTYSASFADIGLGFVKTEPVLPVL